MRVLASSATLVLALLLPASAAAHGFGTAIGREVGPYLLELEFQGFAVLPEEEKTLYASIVTGAGTFNWAYVPHDEVRLRIRQGDRVLRELTLRPTGTPTADPFVHRFAEGFYEVDMAFLEEGRQIAEATFELPVAPPPSDRIVRLFAQLFAGFIALAMSILVIGGLLSRSRPRRPSP